MNDIDIDNLKGLMDVSLSFPRPNLGTRSPSLQLWLDNCDEMVGLGSVVCKFSAVVSGLYNAFFGQSLCQAKLNVMDSYDQSNDLFKGFLSKEMMYSCALWSEEEGGLRGDLLPSARPFDLEAAQLRKIHHVLNMARVKPGMKVLEFGSGWGAMAIEVGRTPRGGDTPCAHLPPFRLLVRLVRRWTP